MPDSLKLLPEFLRTYDPLFAQGDLFIFAQKMGIALLIGLLIGLEREHSSKGEKTFAGIRTFPLISIFGFLAALIGSLLQQWAYLVFFLIFSGLVISSYINSSRDGKIGITSELSSLLVFILGSLIYWNYIMISAIISVIIALFLSLKIQIHSFVERVSEEDILAVLKLALVTVIILPLLPEQDFGPHKIINLRILWYMVIFIASLSFLGYVLTKFVGYKKGIFYTGLFGGFVSSTALTFSFAKKSVQNADLSSNLAAGIILASTVVYPKVFLEVLVVNPKLASYMWLPLLLLTICGIVASYIMHGKTVQHQVEDLHLSNPFELRSALMFGLIFGVIIAFAKLSQIYFGNEGTYLVSFIAGLPNIDAITLSMAQLADKSISLETANISILIALLSNTLFKSLLALIIGGKILARTTSMGFGLLITMLSLLLIYFFLF